MTAPTSPLLSESPGRSASTTRRHVLLAAVVLGLAPAWATRAAASELAVGDTFPPLSVNDQFDRPVAVDAGTRLVLFAADKAAGDVATEALMAHPEVLAQQRLVYLADISGMPAVITRMFALPKMRDLPFPVGLVRDAQLTATLPRKAGMLTLMVLEGGTVRGIEYLPDAAAVRSRLGIAS